MITEAVVCTALGGAIGALIRWIRPPFLTGTSGSSPGAYSR